MPRAKRINYKVHILSFLLYVNDNKNKNNIIFVPNDSLVKFVFVIYLNNDIEFIHI